MKKLFIILMMLFSLNSFSQPAMDFLQQTLNYDLSGGDTTLTTNNFLGFSRLSFQLTTTDLDGATSDVKIQKTNNDTDYLDISGASIMFSSGSQTSFIEIENAKNARYKIIVDVNTVTSGTIRIDITATR